MERTVILANGDFPRSPFALALLHNCKHLVACDGAALELVKRGIKPTAVVGDLDSISESLRISLASLIVHVEEQDTNDLNKAFRFCLGKGWTDITILGGTGKREDHTLGNISLLADFACKVPYVRMVTDEGTFYPMRKPGELRSFPGQQVSIFTLDNDTALFSTGLKWPLNGMKPARWWQATLNEAIGKKIELDFTEGKTILIFLQHPKA